MKLNNLTTSFDDRNLPDNSAFQQLPSEQAEKIEQLAMTYLAEELEKLRFEKPHLFKLHTPENILDK